MVIDQKVPKDLQIALAQMVGKDCWRLSAGGIGSTFQLFMGKKVPERMPMPHLKKPFRYPGNVTRLDRSFVGEANLLIWCTWRLDSETEPVASSDQDGNVIESALAVLVGQKVESVEVEPPAWDLGIAFSNRMRLRVFCDHIPPNPSYSHNWFLSVGDDLFYTGPGYSLKKETHHGKLG